MSQLPAAPSFYEDFGSEELDRSRWNVRVTGKVVNDEQQAYVDSPETIYLVPDAPGADGNVLALHPRLRPGFSTPEGRLFDFTSGRIDTRERFQFRYGSASARMRLPEGSGVWPAFWAMGVGRWPGIGEIDIMESVGESDWVSCGLHGPGYSGEAGLINKLFFEGDEATRWHVYTVERAPDRVVFKVDGETVYRVTRPMTEFFGSWAFDDEKYLILNVALGGTYPYKTNGIESPYYGIPADTVARIGDDDVRLLIDWVRVMGEEWPAASAEAREQDAIAAPPAVAVQTR